MAQALWFLLSAGGFALLFLGCAAWVVLSQGSRWSRRVLLTVSLLCCIASTYAVPVWIERLLVAGYAPLAAADVPPGRTAVVLLGSGSHLARDWDGHRFATVDRIGASRVAEAARVYHLLQPDFVISSGGLFEVTENSWPSGSSMADALVSLGVPRDRIVVEDQSETTRREAVIIKELLAHRPVDHVVLVTSPVHMRRSVGTFQAVGLPVIPAIAHEVSSFDRLWEQLIPTDKGLEETGMVAHEVMGLVVYRLRGWYR